MTSLLSSTPAFDRKYEQLNVAYTKEDNAVWARFNSQPRPCFTPTLLREMADLQGEVQTFVKSGSAEESPLRYLVIGSSVKGVFNLGGDLNLFKKHISEAAREDLRTYAYACIDVLYRNTTGLDLPLTTIALVQGSALGGGFEAALSCNVIVAEKGTDFGFPEILFNLFPGMGAYSLLARRVSMSQAEKLITSGRMYKAEELHEMGVVDILADKGNGEEAVRRYIRRHTRARNGFEAIQRVRQMVNPVTYEELADITELWVDTALALTERDLRLVDLLVRSQDHNVQALQAGDEVQTARIHKHPASFA